MASFALLFTFFSYQGKVTKIPSAHISLTYIQVFCSPYDFFALGAASNPNRRLTGGSVRLRAVVIV